MRSITEIDSISKYVEAFSLALGAKVSEHCQPLHDPAKHPAHPLLGEMATKPFPKQADKITAQVKALRRRGQYIDAGMMGTGKAQPNESLVLTPFGWVRIGDIKPGDTVCNPSGGTARVTGVYPQGVLPVNRVRFTDGTWAECCKDHLWEVTTPGRKYYKCKPLVLSTSEIVARGTHKPSGNTRFFIPICEPVEYPAKQLPIEPYLLGAILGDGGMTSHSCIFTTSESEMLGRISEIVRVHHPEVRLSHDGEIGFRFAGTQKGVPNSNAITRKLRGLKLMGCGSQEKFIPQCYLFGSVSQRTAILQGLLDTDGYIEKGTSSIEYCSVSPDLASGVVDLVNSLGGTATVATKQGAYVKNGLKTVCKVVYRVQICLPNTIVPFRLTRKVMAYKPRTKYHPRRGIAKIETNTRLAKCTCIKLDSSNQLYMTNNYIVTHNTMQAIGTIHCDAGGKPYKCMIMCPSHLTKKWRKEIHKFLGTGVRASIIHDWREFQQVLDEPRPEIPTWYIMGATTAKLGYSNRSAAVTRLIKFRNPETGGMQAKRCLSCPRCGRAAMHRGLPAEASDIERCLIKCSGQWCKNCGVAHHPDVETCPTCERMLRPCGEPLYQPKSHKVSPAMMAKARGWRLDYFIRDEAHESKSADSIDGHAFGTFAALAKHVLVLTGTLLAGKSEDIRPLLFRMMPGPFIDMGYGWKDEIPFGTAYGRIQTVTKSSSGGHEKRKQGKGSSKSTSRDIKPGIMPHLFPDFIANYTSFLALTDLATDLPLYTEETVAVPMEPMQRQLYDDMEKQLVDTFRAFYQSDRRMAAKLLGPMLEALLTWPDVPYGRKPVCIDGVPMVIPPVMDRSDTYPKELKLLEIVQQEKAKGRKCFIFSDRDDTKERLMWLLESHGIKAAHLTTAVPPADRLDWLEKHGPACDVGVCNPALVQTGMELFGPGFNFPTLIWYSTGYRLNTLRQASRRAWRIGQTQDCRTIYLYYSPSAQQKAIALMASKLVAAEAIEGKFSDGGLADESVDDDLALQIARSLAEGIEIQMKKSYKPVEASLGAKDRLALLKKRFYQKIGK